MGKMRVMSAPTDRATIIETQNAFPIYPNQSYESSFNINGFNRAETLAGQFRFYRAARVTYIFEPQFTNYQAGPNTTTPDVPFLYMVVNRNDESQPFSVEGLKRMGAMPIKFAKTITKSFKPNNLQGVLAQKQITLEQTAPDLIGALALWSFSPTYDIWHSSEILKPTNGLVNDPRSVGLAPALYSGLNFRVDQDVTTLPVEDRPVVGKLTIKVHWEFKEPRTLNDANNVTVVSVTKAYQNVQ